MPLPTQVHTPVTLRRAFLVLDLQNEFLSPSGRCQIINPSIVDTIKCFATTFREQPNSDVIWVRTEFKSARNAKNPRSDELIICDSAEGNFEDQLSQGRLNSKKTTVKKAKKTPANFDSIEEFLADGQNPCCAPSTVAAQFHDSVLSESQAAKDRVIVKSWYSAFKETALIRFLRGRFISELYISGVKTNVSILATASDAVKHGLNVTILSDCLGYSNEKLHEAALTEMTEVLGVEVVKSSTLTRSWAVKSKGKTHTPSASKEVTKEELEAMLENLSLNKDDEVEQDAQSDDSVGVTDTSKSSDTNENEENKAKIEKQSLSHKQAPDKLGKNTEGSPTKGSRLGRTGVEPQRQALALDERKSKTTSTQEEVSMQGEQSNNLKSKKPVVTKMTSRLRSSPGPVLGEGDSIGEGDSSLLTNILPKDLAENIFDKLKIEVRWRTMHHRGGEVPRLVAVQGEGEIQESIPIYRHPADESPPLRPFSPTVSLIRKRVQEVLKHPVNHVLIQYYRDGNDYISEHSDKTLDIIKGSMIVNVSVGAQRTMILRTKADSKHWNVSKDDSNFEPASRPASGAPRQSQRVPLPHNSMFILGPRTNRKWLHAIKQDKRLPTLKSSEETAFSGERISLTFRNIGTFLTENETKIYGQGAVCKSKQDARLVVNDANEAERMILAFGKENHESDGFDWDKWYGEGFDVLHFKENVPKLCFPLCDNGSLTAQSWSDQTDILAVLSALHEKEINFELLEDKEDGSVANTSSSDPYEIIFFDSDLDKTVVQGSIPILLYLETFYSGDPKLGSKTGLHKPLLPQPQRYERTAYATILGSLIESQKLKVLAQAYVKELALLGENGKGAEEKAASFAKAALEAELTKWEARLRLSSRGILVENPHTYLAPAYISDEGEANDPVFSLADCALWPILYSLKKLEKVTKLDFDWIDRFKRLDEYLRRCISREADKRVLKFVATESEAKCEEGLVKCEEEKTQQDESGREGVKDKESKMSSLALPSIDK